METRRKCASLGLAAALASPVAAQVTSRVSVGSSGQQGNGSSSFYGASISADARYVVFESDASNLVPADTNAVTDIFVRDRLGGPSFTSVCDAGVGDPQVSVRSAALGDTIQPGQSRWYLVYYRDPIVLSGCPASSTFNATQTGQVTWSP